ncbi:MAG: hypothetical protein Q9164_001651 [Protoblastenia rupestris]
MAVPAGYLIVIVTAVIWYTASFTHEHWKYHKASRTHGCKSPPSIHQRDPIFGLDTLLKLFRALNKNQRNQSMRQLFDTYGNTFRSKTWRKTKFYTIEPKNIQAVFGTDFASWGVEPMRLFAFEPFVGKGIMCTDGLDWERSRAMIKPTFARTQIAELHLTAYAAHVQRFMDLLPKDGTMVDLAPLFARLALDSSTEFLFGESVRSLTPNALSGGAQAFLEAYDYGQMVVGKRLQLPKWNFLTRDQKFWKSCKVAHEFVDRYVASSRRICKETTAEGGNHARSEGPKRYVLAHELQKESENQDMIRNQLLNIFLPAHEATAVALTNAFFNLARHPEVYKKLRREVLEAASGKDIDWTFERLKSLKYLQYVINETFRLNPAIGTNTRMALRDTVLPTGGGLPSGVGTSPIFVRKGDIVTFSFYALHRRQDLFGKDSHAFRPERWATLRPAHWSYLTFGGGPRVCPGQQLALMEVAFVIAKMLLAYKEIENRDPVAEFVEVYKITTSSKNGVKVGLIPA